MTNVDSQELAKFSALANYWWDLTGEFKSLHDINPIRVELIDDCVDGLFGKTAIDIGCGGGILSEALANKGAAVTGLDMVDASLQVARMHLLESKLSVDYVLDTAENWAQSHPQQYDVVCCLEMLEHVPDPASVVAACAKLVKPGGKVIFSTLNRNIKSYLMAIIAAEHILGMVPKGTHNIDKFITPAELNRMVEKTELSPLFLTGLHLNPFDQQYFISNKNVDVNYFMVCERII
ncbi:MAG: bifunctional 2-polyprenyl-6-hydroxyphenol methylase/3-demethylubiquinol 3-O-methyltransferase UbiG [Glaciecola sp.]